MPAIPRMLPPIAIALVLLVGLGAEERLRVCASVPDLGSIARAVGGDLVEVTVFAKGGEDPHFVEPRPSFIKALARADALIEIGMELEIGWLPAVVQQAGNGRVQPGARGRITAGDAITPLGVPTGPIDRSQGDVHAMGNPHFLPDPLAGVAIARLLRDRFAELRPGSSAAFAANYAAFATAIAEALAGASAAQTLGSEQVLDGVEQGTLDAQLAKSGTALGGWLAALKPCAGLAVVADHDLWPYFAKRFGLRIVGFLEPKPGLPTTSRHLTAIAAQMSAQQVAVIIINPTFDRRHAETVAKRTGATIASLAHQVGAAPGTDEYLAFIAYDVAALAAAVPVRTP
ncbi:MAG: zinc ABC transporter substrate-binding protein [Planctomycetes bacterium]|nr:zinc ABC transporter substrate-binding protein [Planctomycetota bacterium]